ncbi:hypothetical protein [Mycobacteroides abscessus]|uniref:hypothetical protein n=1 Tax=Mycobacteroides abscessus TaxID=36809 RepID=UPI0010568E18|nr:hypothetical protein [Mycobacteroides abscessus]
MPCRPKHVASRVGSQLRGTLRVRQPSERTLADASILQTGPVCLLKNHIEGRVVFRADLLEVVFGA